MPKRILKSKKLLISTVIIAIIAIIFIASISYKNLSQFNKSSKWVEHTYNIKLNLERLLSNIQDLETYSRGYIITQDSLFIKNYEAKSIHIKKTFNEIKDLTKDNPEQVQNLAFLEKSINNRILLMSKARIYSKNKKIFEEEFKKNFYLGKTSMDSIRFIINKMKSIEKQKLLLRKEDYKKNFADTPILLYSTLLFSLFIIALSYFKIDKDINTLRNINNDLQISQNANTFGEQIGKFGNWLYNKETQKWFFSSNLYHILGFSDQEFEATAENFYKHVYPEDLDYLLNKVDLLVNHKSDEPFTYRMIKKNNEIIFVKSTGRTLKDKLDNEIVAGITQDITEDINNSENLKKLNTELTNNNLYLNKLIQINLQAEIVGEFGTWYWDIVNDKFQFSDNLFRIFGYEPNQVPHKLTSFVGNVHPDDVEIVNEKIKNIYEDKFFEAFTHKIIRENDKATRYINVHSKRIKEDDSDYMLVITQDVTDEVIIKENIIKQNVKLEANNQELQAFNYVASHDLQEPLRKIETFISRLIDKDYNNLTEDGKLYVSRMNNAASRMRNLINDLLQFSRTTRTEKIFETTNLNTVYNNSIQELSHTIEEKHAVIFCDELPILQAAIPFQMQQLFVNILGNSLKYSKEDVPPIIHITYEEVINDNYNILPKNNKAKFNRIVIADNGIGFEQEYENKIFELFGRLHGKQEFSGTGIGLAICKKIIENHNGYIGTESVVNVGSKFIIYLPY